MGAALRLHRAQPGRWAMAPSRAQITRILCPTDFSAFSEAALRRAAKLARWFDARVTVLHVVPGMEGAALPYAPGTLAGPAALARVRREMAVEQLDRFVLPCLDEAPIDRMLTDGHAWPEIVAAAESLPADLVVMGTHG